MKKRKPSLRNTAPAPVAPAIPGETVARVAQRQADMDEEMRLRRRTGDTAVSRLVVSGVPGDAPARRDVPGAIPGERPLTPEEEAQLLALLRRASLGR